MMFSNFKGLKILILGGSGFIGQHLARALHNEGASIRCFDLKKPIKRSQFNSSNNEIEWITGEFSDTKRLKEVTQDIDIIYHLISTTVPASSNKDLKFDLTSNVLSSLELLEAAQLNKVKKIIFISSGGTVYGQPSKIPIPEYHETHPICGYGIHKLTIEKYLYWYKHHYDLGYCVIRLANPYGEAQIAQRAQGVIGNFIYKVIKNETLEIWGDGQVIRDYIFIEDAVEAILLATKYNGIETIFNIGSGEGHSLLDIISIIEKHAGKSLKIEFKDSRQADLPLNILDINKAKTELHWIPKTPLDSGILKIFKYGVENLK